MAISQRFASSSALGIGAAVAALGLVARLVVSHRRRFDLKGKNALITGGARGLGLEIARQLVDRGAHVALVSRDSAALVRAEIDLRERAGPERRIVLETCDLRDAEATTRMLQAVRSRLGPIDVLVNNAGTIQVGPLDAMRPEDFEAEISLHCLAPLRLMLAVRWDMKTRGGGRIANVASVGGLVSVPHLLPYSASKFALVGLSQGMHVELARDGIAVSTIAPGLMRTGSPRNAFFKGDHSKEYTWFAIADSLPLLTVSSARAARRIVRALEHGEPHVVIGFAAKLAALANALAPGLTTRLLTVANTLLPTGSDPRDKKGFESESRLAPSFLTTLSDRAACRNNER